MGIEELMEDRKVFVLLGAGGVGKTSCSIGLAVAAARRGLRVGLLSIDPAKRLAAALGLPLGHTLKPISLGPNIALPGSLKAAMLDQKAVFDSMVYRHAPNKKTAERILNNRLYQAASTKLAGPMEYMALAMLQDMVEDESFDLIVLDTPPDSHALDFLARPNILAGFMENKVMSWLIKPFHVASKFGMEKIFSVGERLMGGLAKVTGFQALRLFTEFLVLMQQVIDGFHHSSEKIVQTLRSPQTTFVLVTVAQDAALRSAKNLALQLARLGYSFDAVLFNKCLPLSVTESLNSFNHCQNGRDLPPSPLWLSHLFEHGEQEKVLRRRFIEDVKFMTDKPPLALAIPEKEHLHHGEAIYDFSFSFSNEHALVKL